METPLVGESYRGRISKMYILKAKAMLELFIELTNQIFREGYAEELAKNNPALFQAEYNEFILNTY